MDYAEFIARCDKLPVAGPNRSIARAEYELSEARLDGITRAFAWISTMFDTEPYRAGPRSEGTPPATRRGRHVPLHP